MDALIVESADYFETAHDTEHAVKASTADLGIEVTSDGDRRKFVGSRPASEDVPDRVDLDGATGRARPADKQIAHFLVFARQRQAAQSCATEAADFCRPFDRCP